MAKSSYSDHFWRRRLWRRTVIRGATLGSAGLVATTVLGCAPEKKPAAQPEAVPAAQPKRGGTLASFSDIGEAPHHDVHQTATLLLADTGMGIAYNRLFRWKLEEGVYPQQIMAEGDLVERWEQPAPQTLIVHLFRGVRWQNLPPVNGREFVAQDVVFSYNRQRAERVNAELLAPISTIAVIDTYTLRFDLERPDADLLLLLAAVQSKIVAPEAVELRGDLKQGPTIGTGPWIFKEWQPNQVVRFVRNPDYFRPGLPYVDELVIFRIQDPQTAQAAFRTRQIQIYDRSNKQIEELLRRDVPGLQVIDAKLMGTGGGVKIWLHTQKAPTTDIRVRQAISKAIDRQAYIHSIMFGSAGLGAGILVPSLDWLLSEEETKRLLAQDLTEARRLLAAAGVERWSPELKLFSPPEARQAGELFVAQLRALNIGPAHVAVLDNVRYLDEVWGRGEFEIGLALQQPQTTTNALLTKFYRTGGSQNGGKLSDTRLDEWIDKQATMVGDMEGRKRLLQDIQRRVIELAAVIPVYNRNDEALIWPFVKNYFQARSGDYSRYEKAWLDV